MINNISDEITTTRMELERLFLKTVNGSCHIPVGGYAKNYWRSGTFFTDC